METKNRFILCTIVTLVTVQLYAMDKEFQPAVPMINSETGQGYLVDLPTEMKQLIFTTIITATSLEDAKNAILALRNINKEFRSIIDDTKITKDLVHMLVAKFGGSHEKVAFILNTPSSKEYMDINNAEWEQWHHRRKGSPEDAKKFILNPQLDFRYTNYLGESIIWTVLWYPETFEYFVNNGANINEVNKSGFSVLTQAIWDNRDLNLIKFILKRMRPEVINHLDKYGRSILHILVGQNVFNNQFDNEWLKKIQLIIKAGASVTIYDQNNETALDILRRKANSFSTNQIIQKAIDLLRKKEDDLKIKQ